MNNKNLRHLDKPRLMHPWQWLDWLYLQTGKGQLFNQGWGDIEQTVEILGQNSDFGPVAAIKPTFTHTGALSDQGPWRHECEFVSPVDYLPSETRLARACLISPVKSDAIYDLPICLSMPGSGDEGYDRRIKTLAQPLAEHGIATLVLENPFYGSRRRRGQNQHCVGTVSDFMLMFYCAVQECKALVHHWLSQGQSRIALTGLSMGGQVICVAASQIDHKLALVGGLAPSTVAQQYSFGHMSVACDWQALSKSMGEIQARTRLRELLSTADITNFQPPVNSICRLINAKQDAYIPAHLSQHFREHWPHSSVKMVNGGHVSSVLFGGRPIVEEIVQTLELI